MSKVLVLGSSGMLGHKVSEVLYSSPELDVQHTNRAGDSGGIKFDLAKDSLSDLLINASPKFVVNCIGLIKQKMDFSDPQSVFNAFQINSYFPKILAGLSKEMGFKVIQIATDCVYKGSTGGYTESSPIDAEDAYGLSKYLGEADNFMNIRTSIVGKELFGHSSLFEWFVRQPQGASIPGYTNHLWNGVSTLVFSQLVKGLISKDFFLPGTFHFSPSGVMSKYDMLLQFAEISKRTDLHVMPFESPQPINRSLSTNFKKINEEFWNIAGFSHIPTVSEALRCL